MPKTFLIDTSRCTACRGCQIACKEWHELPANKTTQYKWGSHQNPQDLNANNYKLVRFNEHLEDGKVRWNFSRTSAVTVICRLQGYRRYLP